MNRVLFVDDDDRVLQGLRRMLRPMRGEWEMGFAQGGEQALSLLAEAPADVLVTDMRMPGFDGTELLARVRERYPQTVRIILSGQAGRDAILHSVRVAHRQLAKPCDADTLKRHVSQACALRKLLPNAALAARIAQVESVPCQPAVYAELEAELAAAEPSLPRVAGIILQDLGMTATILKLANSPLFGLPAGVTNPVQAVSLLGLETIQDLMVKAQVFSRLDPNLFHPFFFEELWEHSQATGALARAIAQSERADDTTVALSALVGLLHDVGKLLLGTCRPEAYEATFGRARPKDLGGLGPEREVFQATHAEAGAYLLGLWGLPQAVIEAVAWHHEPGGFPTDSFGPLTAVHVANALVHEEAAGGTAVPGSGLDHGHLERLGLTGRLPAWRALRQELRPENEP